MTFIRIVLCGMFHGVMTATTPAGSWVIVKPSQGSGSSGVRFPGVV